ncbi:MAG: protein kinase [candidate division KSB1 bacterium]|nr:protein kinase [candidate division KSB1 bacterium]MDZ7366638.1 protein kinase [candidate division KSB1 bacterium]MDZ7404649.1 protein kinase [candidate division KSB1 bacterium]
MPLEAENLSRVVDILKTLGKVYLSKSQYGEAMEKFEDILRLGVKDPEVYRHLAVALAGQRLYTPEALRVYIWAVEKFPHDRIICQHIAQAALHHHAEDEPAQRFYEAALKFHPPFVKDLYLHLHSIFHRQKKYDESFQTLKQALYLEKSGEDQLVTRLTQLGWRYGRHQELIMTLQFLLGNNEKNQTIRRCLAFSLAHTIIRHHCKQKPSEVNLLCGSASDLQLLQAALSPPATLTTVEMVRDYCTLQLALLAAPKPPKDFSAASAFGQQNKSYSTVAAKAFEYRSLLDAQPLEEVLAKSSASAERLETSSTPSNSEFDWQRDFLKHLPGGKNTALDTKLATASAENGATKSAPQTEKGALLVLSPVFPEPQTAHKEISSPSAVTPLQKTIELVAQDLAANEALGQIYVLDDGIMLFSSGVKELAALTVALFEKVARFNVMAPEQHQIVLHAALHALPASRFLASSETGGNANLAGLELLYDTLHLLKVEREDQDKNHQEMRSRCSRLLMSRQIFETVLDAENFTGCHWGPAYWGAPGWHDEVCEIVWYNPLDYASEKNPYVLGRFLVVEKFHEQRAYGTYRTRDRSLERPVVLKALHPEVYLRRKSDKSQHHEMVKAVRRLGRLEHPGVALIYDMGTHEDLFYFVREYIEGENLAQILASQQRLSPEETARLLIEACSILRYAHQNGFYHNNLKPSNIWRLKSVVMKEPTHVRALLAPPSATVEKVHFKIKISDFFIPGFNEIHAANWHYAAPELHVPKHANSSPVPRAAGDIYALGMILYECLRGENPFRALPFPVELSLWEQVRLNPLSTLNHNPANPSLLSSLDEVIQRATHKDPLQRFQTIEQFQAALRQVLKETSAWTRSAASASVS